MTTSPRLPESDRRKKKVFILFHRSCCETRSPESNTCASFSGVSRDPDQVVETCGQVSRDSGPSGTDGKEIRAVVCVRRHRRETGGRCNSSPPFSCSTDEESDTRVLFFAQNSLDLCSTDRDLDNQRPKKLNAQHTMI